jgi:outer membrane protein OmpA-like peptidoglycan-associated protein
MRKAITIMAVALALGAGVSAQRAMKVNYDDVYCSGNVSREAVPRDTYLISGEESSPKTIFAQSDYVYINKGADDGMRIGAEYSVLRPVKDVARHEWFNSQNILARAMGQQWQDVGKIRVVALTPKVATAQVVYTCEWFERGDIVRPYVARSSPTLREEAFDRFAPWNGRPLAMVVNAKGYARQVGPRDVIYVNLGTGQGVKEGDYFRIFRYQGRSGQKVFQIRNIQDRIFGFGSPQGVARHYWSDLPREILGEGVVVRASDNASTVLITHTLKEVFMGDYVELKEPAVPKAAAPAPPPAKAAPAANRPPTLAVSADRPSVLAGERIRISGRAADPDGDNLRYAWRASAGQLSGTGPQVQLDTSGLAPGRYSVTGRVEDGRGGVADGSTTITVEGAPPPPQAGKIADGFYRAESAQPDNVLKRILDDVAVRLQNDPRARALVVGYADSGEANPDRLATQRAEQARAYLAGKGITSARVNTRIAAGQSGAGRNNRRIDVIWIPEGASY